MKKGDRVVLINTEPTKEQWKRMGHARFSFKKGDILTVEQYYPICEGLEVVGSNWIYPIECFKVINENLYISSSIIKNEQRKKTLDSIKNSYDIKSLLDQYFDDYIGNYNFSSGRY